MASSQGTSTHDTNNSRMNPSNLLQLKNKILSEWTRSRSISHILLQIFENSSNPYSSFLTLLRNLALDKYHQNKFSAILDLITEEFYTYIKRKESEYELLLTDDLKMNVMELLVTRKLSQITIDIIIKVFHCDNCLDTAENFTRELISQRKYFNACYASLYFKIQNRFTIEDYIVPLYLLNLKSCIENYLSTTKYHQECYVKYFDDLLGNKDTDLVEIAKSYNVPVHLNNNSMKAITTTIIRTIQMFQVSIEFAPNLAFQMKQSTLRNLMLQCATEGVGIECWREMVTSLVGDNMKVKLYFVKLLDENQMSEEVDYFAKLFSIDASSSFPSIEQMLDKIVDLIRIIPNRNNVVYHKLTLPENQIHMVDSMAKFDEFLDKLNSEFFDKCLNIVGLDCEWKRQVLSSVKTLATIQLATIDSVYIFHIPQLQPTAHFKLRWETFVKTIFHNKDIVKLGYDWKTDGVIIQNALSIENQQLYGRGFIDLKLLCDELNVKWQLKLPHNQNDSLVHTGLSRLVKLCLGNPLKKTDRLSNWENIPLRLDQMKYAALGAYCLLDIYNVLKALCENENIPFKKVCTTVSKYQLKIIMKNKTPNYGHISNKDNYLQLPLIKCNFRTPYNTTFNVKDVKLEIIDELEELAKCLRKYGIDTTIINDSKTVINSEYIQHIIQTKNVFFITMGDLYATEIGNLNKKLWYSVSNYKLEHQVFQVLNYFKIRITHDDLYTRCYLCNSSSYETVSCETMESIFDGIVETAKCSTLTGLNENSDAHSSEDLSSGQATNGSIKNLLLRGYTKENCKINVDALTIHSFYEEKQIFVICNSCGSVVIDNSSKKHLVVI